MFQVTLFYYWAGGCLTAVILVYSCKPDEIETLNEHTKYDIATKDFTYEDNKTYCEQMARHTYKDPHTTNRASTVVRKYFHYLIVCLFLPGIIYDVEMMYMAASCALVVFAMLEVNFIFQQNNSLGIEIGHKQIIKKINWFHSR